MANTTDLIHVNVLVGQAPLNGPISAAYAAPTGMETSVTGTTLTVEKGVVLNNGLVYNLEDTIIKNITTAFEPGYNNGCLLDDSLTDGTYHIYAVSNGIVTDIAISKNNPPVLPYTYPDISATQFSVNTIGYTKYCKIGFLVVSNSTVTKVFPGQDLSTSFVSGTLASSVELSGKQDTLVSGTNIKTVNNTSLLGAGDVTIDSLPSQSGQNGKYLTTDGTNASWANVDALPSQTGQSGKYLTTDGTNTSWGSVDALPSQSGQSGKFLTTDGSAASWATVAVPANAYTRDNLLGSTNISIDKVINPNVLDPETTLACFHFDGDATNVMDNGIDLSDAFKSCIAGYTDGVTYPWYNGKKALIFRPTSDALAEFNMFASSITGIGTTGDFTVEFRVMRPSYSAPDVTFCAGPYYTNVCFNIDDMECVFKTQPSNWGVGMNTNQWYHVVMVRKNGYISLYTPDGRWEHTNSVSSNFTNVGMATYGYNSNVIYIAELCVWNFAKYDGETLVSPTAPYEMSATGSTYNINATGLATTAQLSNKQDTLISGTNIKTVNSQSLLGAGNLDITSLPDQEGQAGKFLTTNGTIVSWGSIANFFTSIPGYDSTKTQVLKNVSGVLTWADEITQ